MANINKRSCKAQWFLLSGETHDPIEGTFLGLLTNRLFDTLARLFPSEIAEDMRSEVVRWNKSRSNPPGIITDSRTAHLATRLLTVSGRHLITTKRVLFEWPSNYAPLVYMSEGPFPRLSELRIPLTRQRAIGTGVGWDHEIAQLKSQAEAMERSVSMSYPQELRFGDETQLRTEPMVSPKEFAPFVRSAHNFVFGSSVMRDYVVGNSINWIRAADELTGHDTWVPADHAVYPPLAYETMGFENSNGCAFHTLLAPAKIAGALELLERDAFLFAWLNKMPATFLTPTFLCPEAGEWLAWLHQQDYELKWVDLSSIHGLPSAALWSSHPVWGSQFTAGIGWGWSEVFEKTLLDLSPALYAVRTPDYLREAQGILHQHRKYFLQPDKAVKALSFWASGEVGTPKSRDLLEIDSDNLRWNWIKNYFRKQQWRLLSVRLSKSEDPYSVFKIISPELQPLYFNERLRRISPARFTGGLEQWKRLNQLPHPIA